MDRPAAAALLLLGTTLLGAPARAADPEPQLTVFAAASMVDALHRIDAAWAKAGHPAPVLSLGASGALARQIESGAPADVFVSADTKWMTVLHTAHLLVPGTETDIAGNTLVLVEPKASLHPVDLAHGFDPDAVLGQGGRLAVGNPASVPAGIYAKEALTSLGVWDRVRDRLAPATDVRAALMEVASGAAPAGIVYGSDAHGDGKVAVAGTFPSASHAPIVYPAAAVLHGHAMAAKAYVVFLGTPAAQRMLQESGFSILAAP